MKMLLGKGTLTATLLIGLLAVQMPTQAAVTNPSVKRVLVLYSMGREFAPFNFMSAEFLRDLVQKSPVPIEFHEASIETVRFSEGVDERLLVTYLQKLFTRRRLDLIATMGGPATLFVNRHRAELFPEVPLIATLDQRRVEECGVTTNMTVVPLQLDLSGPIEDMLQMFPATTNVVVVMGATPFERYWLDQFRSDMARFTNRLTFTYLNDLSLDSMVRRVATLPPHSAVYYGTVVMDAAGVPYEEDSAVAGLRASANAPIFGLFEHELGHGIVGGRLCSMREWGRRVTATAMRILNGESPDQIHPSPVMAENPVYDWRELHRWHLSEAQLPLGSEIRFYQPTLWEQYRWQIIGGIAFCLFEAALVAVLLVELGRVRRAEAMARSAEQDTRALSGRLINAQEQERRRIARDLHDDLNQRLALLSVEMDVLGQTDSGKNSAARLGELANQARDLSSEVHKLAYQLHPAKLHQLGLVAAVDSLCRELSQQSGLKIDFALRDVPRELPDEVALCAFRVVQESLTNVIRHSRAEAAIVELAVRDGRLWASVKDAGKGFNVGSARQAGGLGLMSMQERARLLKGRLEVRSKPGRGTHVELTLRLYREEYSL